MAFDANPRVQTRAQLISLFLISMFNTSCSHMSKDVNLQLKLQSLSSWHCRWPTDDDAVLYFFFLLLFSCRHIRHTRLLHPCLLKRFLLCLWFAHLPRTVLRILSLGRFLVVEPGRAVFVCSVLVTKTTCFPLVSARQQFKLSIFISPALPRVFPALWCLTAQMDTIMHFTRRRRILGLLCIGCSHTCFNNSI